MFNNPGDLNTEHSKTGHFNVRFLNDFPIQKPDKNVQFSNAILKPDVFVQILNGRTLKRPVFEWSTIQNVWFLNGIRKPDHSITEQLWDIRKPDMSSFRIPTVQKFRN